MSYTITSLTAIEDSAAAHGFGETQESRFANTALQTRDTGVSLHRIKPGRRSAFGHRHEHAEEVYVVVSGWGRIKLDDDIVELRELDAIRIAPQVTRSLEAGPDGLQVLAFGPRHEGDGALEPGFW